MFTEVPSSFETIGRFKWGSGDWALNERFEMRETAD